MAQVEDGNEVILVKRQQNTVPATGTSATGVGALAAVADLSLASARIVSALNTQNQVLLDIRSLVNELDILSVASAGTATLQVEVSVDGVNFTTIDNLVAALSNPKHYLNSSVGAAVALCPLAFRFIRITAGAAGVGNTTTLTISIK